MKSFDSKIPLKKIVIVGLPNIGKTQLFNNLTKDYQLVSNSPMTTIEVCRKKVLIDDKLYEIVDTPGIYELYTDSTIEVITRNFIFSEKPDVIIQCVDANHIGQSHNLTIDLLELEIPIVISLNSIDEALGKGIFIDSVKLSKIFNVPVIETVAVTGSGTDELIDAAFKVKKTKFNFKYDKVIEDCLSDIQSKFEIENKDYFCIRKKAMLLLMKDVFIDEFLLNEIGRQKLESIKKFINDFLYNYAGNITWSISLQRTKWIKTEAYDIIKKQKIIPKNFAKNFAKLSRHPVFGTLILLVIVYIMFFLVVHVANNIAYAMDNIIWFPIEGLIRNALPYGFFHDLLIGDYGVLSLGLANAVITVLPILSVFFLLFNTLEDIGYIPNLCILTKKIFDKIGLSGTAVMPLVLGFGCKTMATMTTRSLKSKREKYISIYLIAFAIPCAPQLGLNMSILGRMGLSAFAIAFFVLAFVEIVAGALLNIIIKKEEKTEFIQKLPSIRMPNLKAIIIKTYYRLYWFLKEAVPVFIYASLALFTVNKLGILEFIKKLLSPIMKGFLGLPVEMVDALILCMARQEAAAGLIINLVNEHKLNYTQCIVSVVLTTMFVPCFANIVAMVKELGAKSALSMVFMINVSSFLLAGALHWILISYFIFNGR